MTQTGDPASRHSLHSVLRWLFHPIDAGNLAYFRIAFGMIMIWEVYRYFDHNWISRYYSGKQFYFTYPGFGWVQPWPEYWMHVHFLLVAVFAIFVVLGLFYRLASIGLFFTFSYTFLLEQARYLNHFYFVILICFLLIFIPANRVFSIDYVLRKKRSGKAFSYTIPNWSLWILRLQVGVVYFFGGIAKLTPDWLHGYPLADWISDETHVPVIGAYVQEYWMALFLSYTGLLVDLLIVPMLLWRRTRVFGVMVVFSFNLLNWQLFSIGIFPWLMIFATPLFFETDFAHRMWDHTRFSASQCRDLALKRAGDIAKLISTIPCFTRKHLTIATLLTMYMAFQILFPLRHFLLPGVVHWTEEGHKYSWHMKLRSKQGIVRFRVIDPIMGEMYVVNPLYILNDRQVRKMAARPDMILQFAHYLATKYDVLGHGNIQVYADSEASLNGRTFQTLVKPDVDLAQIRWSILPADWIEPLMTPLDMG